MLIRSNKYLFIKICVILGRLVSSMESNSRLNVNPDLAKERENCPFVLEEVTNLLDGGKEETENRRKFETFLFSKIKVSTHT